MCWIASTIRWCLTTQIVMNDLFIAQNHVQYVICISVYMRRAETGRIWILCAWPALPHRYGVVCGATGDLPTAHHSTQIVKVLQTATLSSSKIVDRGKEYDCNQSIVAIQYLTHTNNHRLRIYELITFRLATGVPPSTTSLSKSPSVSMTVVS